MGLVQDEPSEGDEVFTQEGITYVVNKDLLEQVRPIKLDFIDTPRGRGFFISSNLKKDCGSCGC